MKISKNFEFVVDFYRLCLICFPDEKRPFLQKIVQELENLKSNSKTDNVSTDDWISMLNNLGISDDFKRLSGDLKYSVNCLSSENSSKRKDATGENIFLNVYFECNFSDAYFGCNFLDTYFECNFLDAYFECHFFGCIF